MSPLPWCIPRWLMSSWGASESPRVNGQGIQHVGRGPRGDQKGLWSRSDRTHGAVGRGGLSAGWRGMPTPRCARRLPTSKPLQEGRPLWPFLGPRATASRCH